MNETPHFDADEPLDIDDPRVPDVVRAHGRRFRKPVRSVSDLGEGEYLLFDLATLSWTPH